MSVNSHLGVEQSRRDDLESLAYLFVYFLRQGKLPWSGLKASTLEERYRKIGEVKQNTPVNELCAGFPSEFADFLTYTRRMQFDQDPNYEQIKKSFSDLFCKLNFEEDNQFDWDGKL